MSGHEACWRAREELMSRGKHWWHPVVMGLGLAPVAFCAEQVVPHGIPTAEGCSGSFSAGEGWQSLGVPTIADEPIPVATDGFVVLTGRYDDEQLDVDISGVSVSATNDGGEDVPGELKFLRSVEDNYHGNAVYLSWEANSELEIGTHLTLAVAATPAPRDNIEATVELEVVGAKTPLPVPTAALGSWFDYEHAVGSLVTCETEDGLCGDLGRKVSFPADTKLLVGNVPSWKVPPITGMVAWEVRAEATEPWDSRGWRPEQPWVSRSALVFGAGSEAMTQAGEVIFAEDASEYCATIVVRDLRTGQELRSEPACDEPGAVEWARSDSPLLACTAPPSEELKPRWCMAHPADELCQPSDSEGGEAGQPAGAGNDAAGGVEGGEGGRPAAPRSRASHSSSCQFGPADAASGFGALSLAALALLRSRNSRRRGVRR
jgi:hypothetical protein